MIDADDGRSTTRVVFSLSVRSATPILAFADIPRLARSSDAGDGFSYDFGTASSVDVLLGTRSNPLEATVAGTLDRLDATGIDPDELAADDRIVVARFSVSPGSETLPASVVERLARIHASIVMDSWG